MTRPWEESGEIPDRMHTDGGLAMEQDPADYYGDALSLSDSTWDEMDRLKATPEMRERRCSDSRRFFAEMQAVSELTIWFNVWKLLAAGYVVTGHIEMNYSGDVTLLRRGLPSAPERDD